jgi:hypothetical protein
MYQFTKLYGKIVRWYYTYQYNHNHTNGHLNETESPAKC